jgi:hypothetical protein
LPQRHASEETCFARLQSYIPQSKVSDAIEAVRKKIRSLGKGYIPKLQINFIIYKNKKGGKDDEFKSTNRHTFS